MGYHFKGINGARFGGRDLYEAKLGGNIIWPVYSLALYSDTITLSAGSYVGGQPVGDEVTVAVSGVARNEDGEEVRIRVQLSASDLTITKLSGDPNNQITRNGLTFSVQNLGTTPTQEASATYMLLWTEKGVSINITVKQAANEETFTPRHTETTSYGGLVFYPVGGGAAVSEIPIIGGTYTIEGTRDYEVIAPRYDYTSGAHTGGDVESYGSETQAPTSVSCSTATTSGADIDFASNAKNTDPISHSVYATYDGATGHGDIEQLEDFIAGQHDEVVADSYEAYVTFIGTPGVTAVGGSCTLQARAQHEAYTVYEWESGAVDVGPTFVVPDSFTVSQDNGGASQAHFHLGSWSGPDANGYYFSTVDHDNMAQRDTDRVQFTVENDSDPNVYDTTSWLVVTNAAHHSYADVFSVVLGDDTLPFTGGTVDVNYVAVYRDTITYDSQITPVIVDTPYNVSLVTNVGTLAESAVGGSGQTTLDVPANQSYSTRTVTVQMFYIAVEKASDSLTQQESLVQYIYVSDMPTASSRTTTIHNSYGSALDADLTINVYDDTTHQLVDSDNWSGTVPANGSTAGPTLGYGYGYYIDFTVNSVSE